MNKHVQAVVSSALWAAAGDAVGWIGELTDERGVRRRVGTSRIRKPVSWRRKLGRNGPSVLLPAGTYSDDTQLRLAVSRATRGTGEFDVEAFAKVELPVWLGYFLGGGRGTVTAAANLSRNNVAWFSNFFASAGNARYVEGGGNGAAMRIQPHVWKSDPSKPEQFLADVFRDAIVTHGAPQGFCGAALHALCLAHALHKGAVPEPSMWRVFLHELRNLPEVVRSDSQLSAFWLGAWEREAGTSLSSAINAQVDKFLEVLRSTHGHVDRERHEAYRATLTVLGGFDQETRGAGINTALAAVALAWLFRDGSIEEALLESANALSSDTDTIGSMAGAILGAASPCEPHWALQDRSYIESEARRMAAIASGEPASSFAYPDLANWEPPSNQSDSVRLTDSGMVVRGLGTASPEGEISVVGDSEWQWLRLEFGQTVFAKRRRLIGGSNGSAPVLGTSEKNAGGVPSSSERPERSAQPELFEEGLPRSNDRDQNRSLSANEGSYSSDLNALTDRVIMGGAFDAETIGQGFLEALEGELAVNQAVAYAAIIAKAIIARRRRRTITAS